MSKEKPWEDVEESGETRALKEKTDRLRREGLSKRPPAKKLEEIGATDAWGPAERAERRQNKIKRLTSPWGKAANNEK